MALPVVEPVNNNPVRHYANEETQQSVAKVVGKNTCNQFHNY
jgi:hypothetical protein